MYPRQNFVSWDILRISPSWDNPGLSSSASLSSILYEYEYAYRTRDQAGVLQRYSYAYP